MRAVKKLHGPITPEERGVLLEGWDLHLLRTHAEEGALFDDLHYWAPHPANRTEVDFLLRRGGELAAFEVKSQPRYHAGMLMGLHAIAELPGLARRAVIYGGKRSFRTADGIDMWSTERLHHGEAGASPPLAHTRRSRAHFLTASATTIHDKGDGTGSGRFPDCSVIPSNPSTEYSGQFPW